MRGFVDQPDLAAPGFALPVAVENRPPFPASRRLKFWLSGNYHRLRSARKMEVDGRDALSLLGRTGRIQPTHNPLWHFGRAIFKQTVPAAVHLGGAVWPCKVLDGPKSRAAARAPQDLRKEGMAKLLAQRIGSERRPKLSAADLPSRILLPDPVQNHWR